ncbi:hypothetical protein EDEG_03209 [Edhazardia aedis USNM 41457]|uniref:Uncharacterized protein n=1 Tax=Edhazardia aedis (strain USNM 41457) TaxID=1003232 RepID=J9DI97_EDHAE|nr:hypothetical protein EDEG_03209 [Edhazardia aedis USNM 41457]|eukprot:EJW02350.1 hypothetical protein EDEG_03209 [Edhazardia aedis USNM 41457]
MDFSFVFILFFVLCESSSSAFKGKTQNTINVNNLLVQPAKKHRYSQILDNKFQLLSGVAPLVNLQKQTPKENLIMSNGPFIKNIQPNPNKFASSKIIFPSIYPILDVIAAADPEISCKINLLFDNALLSIKNAIKIYSDVTIPAIAKPIDLSVATLKLTIKNAFIIVTGELVYDINKFIGTVLNDSNANISTLSASLLTDLQKIFFSAEADVQKLIDITNSNTKNIIDTTIIDSGESLFLQVKNILADTTNKTAIMPQLTYINAQTVENIITENWANISAIIELILSTAANKMQITISKNIFEQVSAETTILESLKPGIIAIITVRVNSMLKNLETALSYDTSIIIEAVKQQINLNLDTMLQSIRDSLVIINSEISLIVKNSANFTVQTVEFMIRELGQSIINQLKSILKYSG